MVVDTITLGVVDDLDEVVDILAEEEITASITGRSRVCSFQVISSELSHPTKGSSGENFAARYRVDRPQTQEVNEIKKWWWQGECCIIVRGPSSGQQPIHKQQ